MNSVRAIWTNGRILPSEPVDWPEGSELRVEPVESNFEQIGMSESEWGDDPESIAEWIAAVQKFEPLIRSEEEREDYDRYREKCRQFNIEAVRQQMASDPEGDTP